MSENNQTIHKGRGGARKGAGRKPGAITQRTRDIANGIIEDGGVTPLEFMLQIMREEPPEGASPEVFYGTRNRQFEAAKAAAPYVHPRLAAVEVSGDAENPLQIVGRIELVGVRPGA
jgi:hypothetical protein